MYIKPQWISEFLTDPCMFLPVMCDCMNPESQGKQKNYERIYRKKSRNSITQEEDFKIYPRSWVCQSAIFKLIKKWKRDSVETEPQSGRPTKISVTTVRKMHSSAQKLHMGWSWMWQHDKDPKTKDQVTMSVVRAEKSKLSLVSWPQYYWDILGRFM